MTRTIIPARLIVIVLAVALRPDRPVRHAQPTIVHRYVLKRGVLQL